MIRLRMLPRNPDVTLVDKYGNTYDRCRNEEVYRGEGTKQEAYRRCTRDEGHAGACTFGSWCLR
jgi:hypothetical protein